jgi:hypothetical protein
MPAIYLEWSQQEEFLLEVAARMVSVLCEDAPLTLPNATSHIVGGCTECVVYPVNILTSVRWTTQS